jgi:EAL domain-containing protein (putative c-di-GMP-specific phosphodiesterase class I)
VKAEENLADPVAYLRQALAEDAFALFCQPICALTKPLTFPIAEALVRLREEETALCPPGEFLPVLEHYGLMPALDRWVVRRVLRHLKGGAHARLSVNLSAQTLADQEFAPFVSRELKASGVTPDRLLFEIDEPDALLPAGRAFAAAIGGTGSGVIIDGLGRGADYIEPLRTPSVKLIKVCSSLTRQLIAPGALSEELRALLQAAAGLGIKVIAECVEDKAALVALHKRGIPFAQGFGIVAPRPIESFARAPQGA